MKKSVKTPAPEPIPIHEFTGFKWISNSDQLTKENETPKEYMNRITQYAVFFLVNNINRTGDNEWVPALADVHRCYSYIYDAIRSINEQQYVPDGFIAWFKTANVELVERQISGEFSKWLDMLVACSAYKTNP